MAEKNDPTIETNMPSNTASSEASKEKVDLPPVLVDTIVEGTITKDGIKIHPQPTSDPLDPLNWSRWRKYPILAIVMIK